MSRFLCAITLVVSVSAQNPNARINVTPGWVLGGGPDFPLGVSGTGIFDGLVIRWNGVDHPLVRDVNGGFHTTISAAEIAQPGLAEVDAYYPPTGVTFGPTQYVVIAVPISISRIIYDSARNLIYAALLASPMQAATQIAVIDPVALKVIKTITVGSSPNLMALSDDAHFLYVTLDGEAAIQRIDLNSNTPDLKIPIGPAGTVVSALRVMPGSPETIAIARGSRSVSSGSTVIFDGSIKRSKEGTAVSELVFGASPSVLYGSGGTIFRMTIDEQGIASSEALADGIRNYGMEFYGGRLYFNDGHAIDPETGAYAGDIGVRIWTGGYAIDPERRRYYAFPEGGIDGTMTRPGILAFDLDTLTPFGTVAFGSPLYRGSIDNAFGGKIIHWGDDGLAFFFEEICCPAAGNLNIIRTPLAGPAPTITGIEGMVAAGQTMTITGTALGPRDGRQAEYSAPGQPSTSLGGTQVYFDATPAQMLYSNETRIDLIVPPSVGGIAQMTTMQVLNTGIPSAQVVLTVGSVNPSVSP